MCDQSTTGIRGDDVKNAKKWPWLAIAVGVASTIIGIIIGGMNAKSTADDAVAYLIMAGILTAFGPIVLSHAISKNLGRNEARAELEGHLGSISMNLGQAAAALDNALRRNAAGIEDPKVTLTLAHNIVSNIEVQIGQLQKVIGAPFSADNYAETKDQLIHLGNMLTKAAEENDSQSVLEATRNIQKAVRNFVRPNVTPSDEVEVRCPVCGNPITQAIGANPGATSRTTCSKCSSDFNIHRGGDGIVFVRLPPGTAAPTSVEAPPPTGRHLSSSAGSSTSGDDGVADDGSPEPRTPTSGEATVDAPTPVPAMPKKIAIKCPSCNTQVRFWLDPRRTEGQRIVCLHCDTGITVDSGGGITAQEPFSRKLVPIERGARQGYVVLCPDCGQAKPCKIHLEGSYFGYCLDDKLTLAVDGSAIADYELRVAPIPA